jgi:hypothetical protein
MSQCCADCFSDEYLRKVIQTDGMPGDCDFCDAKNTQVIDVEKLATYFDPVISLYTAQVEFMWLDQLKECEGRFIWEVLAEDWDIFDDWERGREIIEAMYEWSDPSEERPLFLDNYVDKEEEYYGTENEFSDKLERDWLTFCDEISRRHRFFPQTKFDLDLLSEILSFSEYRIQANQQLFRARLCDEKKLPPRKMGPPPPDKAVDGRANPGGIAYLYLASDAETAISEVRPQLENRVTVGKFKTQREIRIVDLRDPHVGSPFRWGDRLEFVLKVQGFLRRLGLALSEPVGRTESVLNYLYYLPTQYLCEFIRHEGYDGVSYRSRLGKGHNTVLFDPVTARCISTRLYRVKSLDVTPDEMK